MKKRIITLVIIITTALCSYALGTHNGREGYVKLEECIPLEDVACWYMDGYGYPCFELKDVTHQLDDFDNANYSEITSKLEDITEDYINRFLD